MGALSVTARAPTNIAPPARSSREVTDAVLNAFAADAPVPLLQHINRSIQHAYAVMGARAAAAKQLPFEGDAFGVYDRLVAKVGPLRAAETWGTVLLAVSTGRHGWQEKLDSLMEWDAGGLGDSMWRIAGDKMASANAVNKTFTNLNESGWWSDGGDGTESDLRTAISVSATPASRDLAAAWGCVVSSSWAFWKSTCSNELEVFFKQYSSDMANLDQMSGTFLNNANRDSGLGTNSSDIAAIRGAGMGWGRLTDWVLGMMGQNNEGNSLNGEGWADPIPQLQTTGGAMLGAGGALVAAAKAGEIASESAVGMVNPLAYIGGKLLEMVGPLGWLLVAIGFLLAVVVPYMPLIYFFLAALSWLILAVQTIITAPFWLMQMFYPNRQGGLQGTSIARALMVLLALLVRPALIIIGLIFCMMLMRVGLDFLNILTRNAYAAMAYAGPVSAGGQLGNIALAIGGFMIYASAAVALVSICCGLIDGVGDAVMDGVEAGMSRFLGSQAQRGEGMLGNPAAAAASQIAIGGRGSLAGTGSQIARMRNQPRGGLGNGGSNQARHSYCSSGLGRRDLRRPKARSGQASRSA